MLDIFILKTMTENVEQELGKLPNPVKISLLGKRKNIKGRMGGKEAKYEVQIFHHEGSFKQS